MTSMSSTIGRGAPARRRECGAFRRAGSPCLTRNFILHLMAHTRHSDQCAEMHRCWSTVGARRRRQTRRCFRWPSWPSSCRRSCRRSGSSTSTAPPSSLAMPRFISAILLVLCPRTSSSASARCARCRARAHDEPAAAHSTHLSPPPASATGTTPTTSRMIVCITTSTGARTMSRAAESLGVF